METSTMRSTRPVADEIADRHSGTLAGRLAQLDNLTAAHVVIVVSQVAASTRCGQLGAIWLANLLGRLSGVIDCVSVEIEGADQSLQSAIDPRDPLGDGTLAASMVRSAGLSNAASASRLPRRAEANQRCVVLGVGHPERACDLYMSASAWLAYIGSVPGPECIDDGLQAVGSVVTATLATAEVFKMLRASGARAVPVTGYTFDAWNWRPASALRAPRLQTIPHPVGESVRLTLAGVGAVGTSFLLTLWGSNIAVDATILDADAVARTNLNRYPLFGLDDVRHSKVERAKALLETSRFAVTAYPMWWSEYQRRAVKSPELLISGVDTNIARHQLQDALPRLVLGASTNRLRAEVSRYDLAQRKSRCLKCFNAPEASEDDVSLQRRLLAMEGDELIAQAIDRCVPVEQLIEYVSELRSRGNACAILAGDQLEKLRIVGNERAFAVSFVSAFAGAMLAAQVIRESVGDPLLVPPTGRGVFQFWRPEAPSNRIAEAPIEQGCWCNNELVRSAHLDLWRPNRSHNAT